MEDTMITVYSSERTNNTINPFIITSVSDATSDTKVVNGLTHYEIGSINDIKNIELHDIFINENTISEGSYVLEIKINFSKDPIKVINLNIDDPFSVTYIESKVLGRPIKELTHMEIKLLKRNDNKKLEEVTIDKDWGLMLILVHGNNDNNNEDNKNRNTCLLL